MSHHAIAAVLRECARGDCLRVWYLPFGFYEAKFSFYVTRGACLEPSEVEAARADRCRNYFVDFVSESGTIETEVGVRLHPSHAQAFWHIENLSV